MNQSISFYATLRKQSSSQSPCQSCMTERDELIQAYEPTICPRHLLSLWAEDWWHGIIDYPELMMISMHMESAGMVYFRDEAMPNKLKKGQPLEQENGNQFLVADFSFREADNRFCKSESLKLPQKFN